MSDSLDNGTLKQLSGMWWDAPIFHSNHGENHSVMSEQNGTLNRHKKFPTGNFGTEKRHSCW